MTDAFLTGLHHALVATAYTAGAGLVLAMVAALVLIALVACDRASVTRTSLRLHRQARRSGRGR